MLTLIIGGFILHIFYSFIHKKLPGIKGRESCWGDFGGGGDDGDEGKYETAVAPSREFQQSQMDLWKSTYEPYAKDVYDLWSSYGKPIKEAESKYYLEKGLPQTQELMGANFEDYMNLMRPYTQDQFALWNQFGKPQTEERYKQAGEVFLPAQRALGGKLAADVESPGWIPNRYLTIYGGARGKKPPRSGNLLKSGHHNDLPEQARLILARQLRSLVILNRASINLWKRKLLTRHYRSLIYRTRLSNQATRICLDI